MVLTSICERPCFTVEYFSVADTIAVRKNVSDTLRAAGATGTFFFSESHVFRIPGLAKLTRVTSLTDGQNCAP